MTEPSDPKQQMCQKISGLLSQPDQFRQWLENRSDSDEAGLAGEGCFCPLSVFLKSSGINEPEVTECSVWFPVQMFSDRCEYGNASYWNFSRKSWIAYFISNVDAMHGTGDSILVIEAKQALESAIAKANAAAAMH